MEITELNQKMRLALEQAWKGHGKTFPNPAVGAVVVDPQGHVLGQGFHPKAGEPHAEVFAIREALEKRQDLSGCTLLVTLEPCNHFGKTPPCTELIINSKISNVVAGCVDANPQMRGQSLRLLTEAGVEVIPPQLLSEEIQEECAELIRGFQARQRWGRPFVTLKAAVTLDGKVATSKGESKWITSELARNLAHRERQIHGAVLVGVETVLADDPHLNVRLPGEAVQGITKIILDSRLRTPPTAKVFSSTGKVIIFADAMAPANRAQALETAGAQVVRVASVQPGRLDLANVLEALLDLGIEEVLVEGGAQVLGAFAEQKLFDRVVYFVAPKIMGGQGRSVFEGFEASNINSCIGLKNFKAQNLGSDIVLEGRVR